MPLLKFSEKDTFVASNSERPILFAANMFAKSAKVANKNGHFANKIKKRPSKSCKQKTVYVRVRSRFWGCFPVLIPGPEQPDLSGSPAIFRFIIQSFCSWYPISRNAFSFVLWLFFFKRPAFLFTEKMIRMPHIFLCRYGHTCLILSPIHKGVCQF